MEKQTPMEIRLQKYFTDCGIMSRRAAEKVIEEGLVKVNGKTAHLGQKIIPGKDRVEYNGELIVMQKTAEKLYIMLNKPRGVITSLSDEKGRRCIADLIKDIPGRVYPVGRLDYNSDGLLLLSNDGEFTNRLTHPKHSIPKIYFVKVSGKITSEQMHKLTSDMVIDGYKIEPVQVDIYDITDTSSILQFTLFEGRNRQIRKMCEQAGLRVLRLKRIAIGTVQLGDLPAGKWRHLTAKEVRYLMGKNKD
ncbi:MAG: rRNA pseudouridine synthase [Clostridia bacterium]|nr:rRNA pseudouridine synthase [Clostridia bacterium]